jgi:hypothetical protein
MRTASALVTGGAVALAVTLTSVPARAAAEDETIVTFSVSAGSLDIVAPAGPIDLGSAPPGASLSGQIGPVTVTDTRGGNGIWAAEVTSTDFTAAALTVPASAIRYWSGPATATVGAGTFIPGQPTSGDAVALSTVTPVPAFAHTGAGGSAATWNPTLIVNIPPISQVGDYTGVVTHSVA